MDTPTPVQADPSPPPPYQYESYFSLHITSPYMNGIKQTKRWEVFFPGVFTASCQNATIPNLALPVTRLSHVTHNHEAQGIINKVGDVMLNYQFSPHRKLGKAYSWTGYPIGESFRYIGSETTTDGGVQRVFQYVSKDESVMPEGYYLWWTAQPTLDENNLHPVLESARSVNTCPNYLTNPRSSPYGNVEFSGNLYQLLRDYQQTYSSDPNNLTDVYLLLGGTLQYIHEICCVIIVCAEKHRQTNALKDYPPIPQLNGVPKGCQEPTFLSNGLTDEPGRVNLKQEAKPQFYPMHVNTKTNWANLTFAFYFDSPVNFITQGLNYSEIAHEKCCKTQPPAPYKSFVCPNLLPHP